MTFRWKIAQAAEIRWWQRYLKNKPTTDYADWKTDYWQKLLTEMGLSALNIEERNPDLLGTEGGGIHLSSMQVVVPQVSL